MGASTCCAEAEPDTQFTVFDLSALKKQCLISNETEYFGKLTKAALINFQKANNIIPAVGFFGPITRGVVNN